MSAANRVIALRDQLALQVEAAEHENELIAQQVKRARRDAAVTAAAKMSMDLRSCKANQAKFALELQNDDLHALHMERLVEGMLVAERRLEKLRLRQASRAALRESLCNDLINPWEKSLSAALEQNPEAQMLSEVKEKLNEEKKKLIELQQAAGEMYEDAALECESLRLGLRAAQDRVTSAMQRQAAVNHKLHELRVDEERLAADEENVQRVQQEAVAVNEELVILAATVARGRARISQLERELQQISAHQHQHQHQHQVSRGQFSYSP